MSRLACATLLQRLHSLATSEASLAPRTFQTEGDVHFIVQGLLARDLPRALWTHEAHLAAMVAILAEHPDIHPEMQMRDIISGYNVACGGVNDDTQGYHDTMTHIWIQIARAHIAQFAGQPLLAMVNALVSGPDGDRNVPLRYYSRQRLFSVEARRSVLGPDLAPLPIPA